MSFSVKKELLVMANLNNNNNKFWIGWVDEQGNFESRYGRVGSKGASVSKSFGNHYSAQLHLDKKILEKKNKGYKLASHIISDINSNSNLPIEDIAINQIRTIDETGDVKNLISFLSKQNIHSILDKTDLSYDEDTGMFKTELGFLTKESISEARSVLVNLSSFIENNNADDSDIAKNLLADYLMIVPQKIKILRKVSDVISCIKDIEQQHEILDDLEISASQYKNPENNKKLSLSDYPSVFNSSLNIVTDGKIISEINKMFNETKSSIHQSSSFKISRVFEVNIDSMTEDFEKDGSKFGNVQRLWHGTRSSNIISILKSGLIIPPLRSGHVTGRMFGNGLYFSDQSTKSLNYSSGFWGGSSSNICYMFICDVAMGKPFIPSSSDHNLHQKGYDSCFAKGMQSGVRNNEMIVYKTSQSIPRYLVEFSN